MNCCMVALALLAVISTATCTTSRTYGRYSDRSLYSPSESKYIQYIRERNQLEQLRTQFESVCPDHVDELDDAVLKVKECTDQIDEQTETACSAVKKYFLRCSRPMINLLEKCFPETSFEVPSMVFESINSGIQYLCKTDGEHIFELANTCLFKTNYRTVRCERRIKTKLQQYKNKPPTKTEICDLAQSLKPCLQNHLQDSCGNQITREAFMGIFDAITVPCKSVTSNQIDANSINEVELL